MGDKPHQKCHTAKMANRQTKKLKTVKTFCTNKLTSFLTICNISALAKATPLGEPSILSTLLFSLLDGIKMDVPVSVLMRFTEKYKQKHMYAPLLGLFSFHKHLKGITNKLQFNEVYGHTIASIFANDVWVILMVNYDFCKVHGCSLSFGQQKQWLVRNQTQILLTIISSHNLPISFHLVTFA